MTGKIVKYVVAAVVMAMVCLPSKAVVSRELRSMDHVTLSTGVTLTPFLPENGTGTAIIVCPGGSYHWLDEKAEGLDVAKWLQGEGIAAFVLRYKPGTSRHKAMYDSMESAVKYIRTHAAEYGIDPTKVGAMGFSAGGHLVMAAAENFAADPDLHLDFVAPLYPVVTMDEPFVHKRSRRGLLTLSERKDAAVRARFSTDRNIPENCPPVFLLNCGDDAVVNFQNSVMLALAMTEADVNYAYVMYPEGGHGFGADSSRQGEFTSGWQAAFIKWLGTIGK